MTRNQSDQKFGTFALSFAQCARSPTIFYRNLLCRTDAFLKVILVALLQRVMLRHCTPQISLETRQNPRNHCRLKLNWREAWADVMWIRPCAVTGVGG